MTNFKNFIRAAECRFPGGRCRCKAGFGLVAFSALFFVGCSGGSGPQPKNEKPVTPISGLVQLDGKPGSGIRVIFNQKGGMDMTNPTSTQGRTDEKGQFYVTTYRTGDGVPPGEYQLTFLHHGPVIFGAELTDKFQGAYADPKKSTHTVTVPDGDETVDLGTFDLTNP